MVKKIVNQVSVMIWNIKQSIKYSSSKRDKSIVLFGGWFGKTFTDNSRFLFQYLSQNKDKYALRHVVWVTRDSDLCNILQDMGYEAYLMDSKESLYYHKKSAYHIICNHSVYKGTIQSDILVEYSNGAVKINLWHGAGGIKGVNHANRAYQEYAKKHPVAAMSSDFLNSIKLYRRLCGMGGWRDCYYLCTSPYSKKIMKAYFPLPDNNFIISSYPRTKECVKLMPWEEDIIRQVSHRKSAILYLPTFRDGDTLIEWPDSNFDFINYLNENEILWITKKHEADKNDKSEVSVCQNLMSLPSDFDINVLIPHVDAVVSDYSSVVFDAVYFRIPIFFYIPDFENYRSMDRGFLMKPEEFLIGDVAYDITQLISILKKYQLDYKKAINKDVEKIRKKIWGEDAEYEEIWNSLKDLKP